MSIWWITILVGALVAMHDIETTYAIEGKKMPSILLGIKAFCAVRLVLELFNRL